MNIEQPLTPPDLGDEDRPEHMNIADKVEYFLEHCPNLDDYIEETELLASATNSILNDADDDKLGRIRDLYSNRIKYIARFVESNYEKIGSFANHIYQEMLRSLS